MSQRKRRVLRSTEWDGPPPVPGDVVLDDGSAWLVAAVAAGPGCGQYRLDVEQTGRLIRWATPTAT